MCIHGGGTGQRYYRRQTNVKKGICPNKLSVRETTARDCVLGVIRKILTDERAVAVARAKVAERLAAFSGGLVCFVGGG